MTRIQSSLAGAMAIFVAASLGAGTRLDAAEAGASPTTPPTAWEQQWGVKPAGLHLSAGGHILDFRYQVVDSAKAVALSDPALKPCMIDQATGTKMGVPTTPKLGPLRQSSIAPEEGRVYFILFANPGKLVKAGDKVTIVIGKFKAEDLIVQ